MNYGRESDGDAVVRLLRGLEDHAQAVRAANGTKGLRREKSAALAYVQDLLGVVTARSAKAAKPIDNNKRRMMVEMFGEELAAKIIGKAESDTKELEAQGVAFKSRGDKVASLADAAAQRQMATLVGDFLNALDATMGNVMMPPGDRQGAISSLAVQLVAGLSQVEVGGGVKSTIGGDPHAAPYVADLIERKGSAPPEQPRSKARTPEDYGPLAGYLEDLGQLRPGLNG